jgi:hypothetical protein
MARADDHRLPSNACHTPRARSRTTTDARSSPQIRRSVQQLSTATHPIRGVYMLVHPCQPMRGRDKQQPAAEFGTKQWWVRSGGNMPGRLLGRRIAKLGRKRGPWGGFQLPAVHRTRQDPERTRRQRGKVVALRAEELIDARRRNAHGEDAAASQVQVLERFARSKGIPATRAPAAHGLRRPNRPAYDEAAPGRDPWGATRRSPHRYRDLQYAAQIAIDELLVGCCWRPPPPAALAAIYYSWLPATRSGLPTLVPATTPL